jgi:hypothetical protein
MASGLIDGARQSVFDRFGFLCRGVFGWPAAAALSIERRSPPITFDVHLQDRGVVHEAVDGRQHHGLIWEDLAPFAEWLVGRDQH